MALQEKHIIDVSFDFTTDTAGFWTSFWDKDPYLGWMGNDPDACSKTLKKYHQLLWSKTLPNGQKVFWIRKAMANIWCGTTLLLAVTRFL